MKKKHHKLEERLPISHHVYHNTVSILIGVGIGLVFLAIVGFATRDSRPTQYFLLYVQQKLGIERTQTPGPDTFNESF